MLTAASRHGRQVARLASGLCKCDQGTAGDIAKFVLVQGASGEGCELQAQSVTA